MSRKINYGQGIQIASFLILNPILLLILIVGLMLTGGLVLSSIISNFFNIWLWIPVILIGVFIKPQKSMPLFAVLIGLIPWALHIYREMQAWAWWCQIPVIGWFSCAAADAFLFIPRMISLGIFVASAYIMLFIVTFIVLIAIKSKGR